MRVWGYLYKKLKEVDLAYEILILSEVLCV